MLNALVRVFVECECMPYPSIPGIGTRLRSLDPLALAHIPTTPRSSHRFNMLALSTVVRASLVLASASLYEVSVVLSQQGKDGTRKSSSHAGRLFAPGSSPCSQDLERIE